jgi:Holliday junction resolvase RusA-like endonuclease
MPLLNANMREHWSKRAHLTSDIRILSRNLSSHIPRLEKVKIRAVYYAPNNRRRDMSNIFPSVKAAVDGLTDSGVLKDDSDRYVVSLELLRGEGIIPGGQLVIEVISVEDCESRLFCDFARRQIWSLDHHWAEGNETC